MAKTAVELFTAENRPVCKRCESKMAVLSKGKLAYNGFCSGCYQADKTERRASEARGNDRENWSGPKTELDVANANVSSAGQGGKPADKASTGDKLAGERQPGRGNKTPPGGYHHPQPSAGPATSDTVRQLPSRFGWCQTGHHNGKPMDELYPNGLSGLLAGSVPVTCPGVIWLSPTGEWLSCPCHCHSVVKPPVFVTAT